MSILALLITILARSSRPFAPAGVTVTSDFSLPRLRSCVQEKDVVRASGRP